MPIYFFDVSHDGAVVTDEFGIELDDLYEAREQAIALLPDMARHELPDGDRHEFSAVVRCHEGRVRYVARLVFEARWVEPPTYEPEAHAAHGAAGLGATAAQATGDADTRVIRIR